MGRDVSVVCSHDCCENADIRAIISSDTPVSTANPTVRFQVKPHKIYLFSKDTGMRIHVRMQ